MPAGREGEFRANPGCIDYLSPRSAWRQHEGSLEMSAKHDNAHHDAHLVRNFGIVLAGLTVLGIIIAILARMVYSNFAATTGIYDENMEARLAPVGQVNTSGETVTLAGSAPTAGAAPAATPVAASPGEAAYNQVCFACHAQGIAGAPKLGDAAAWEARIAQGNDTLYKHAIEGFTGPTGMMPPKGGAVDMADEDIKGAVDFMVRAVQGSSAAAVPAAVTAAPVVDSAVVAPTTDAEPAVADAGKGKEVYDAACFACHTPGAAGAPKFGDAAVWSVRVAKGMELLYDHSINGFMGEAGLMPPKGGRPDFSDADIKAAVDYITSNSQ